MTIRNKVSSSSFAILAIVLLAIPTAQSADLTWDGTTSSDWNTTDTNWNSDGTTLWNNATPDNAIFTDTGAGTVTLTEAITAGIVTLSNTVAYTFSQSSGSLTFTTIDSAGSGNVTFNAGVLTGTGTLNNSSGNLTMSGNNSTYSGTINLSGGTIILNNANSLGTGIVNMSGGFLSSSNNTNLNSTLVINATGGRIGGSGPNDTLGITGVLNLNSGGTGVTFNNSINNRALAFKSGSTIAGDAASVTVGRATTFIESGTNITYGGDFLIARTGPGASTLNLGDGIDLSSAGSGNRIVIGNGSNEARIVAVSAGANNATVGDILIQEDDAGVFDINVGTGSTLTVAGDITTDGNDSGVDILGGGTVIYTGNNTYIDRTSLTAGTLQVGNGGTSGTLGADADLSLATGTTLNYNRTDAYTYGGVISGDGAINVNTGTFGITNTSTHTGAVTVAAGANLGGEGTTAGAITWQGTTHSLDFDGTTAAALGTTGTGSLDVSALNVGGFTINMTGLGAGTVDVLQYGSGGFTGAVDRFTAGTGFGSRAGAGTFSDTGTGLIQVNTGRADLIWAGPTGSDWDINTTSSWDNGGSSDVYFDGDVVNFTDTPGAPQTVNVTTAVAPGSVVFSNDTHAYILNGGTLASESAIRATGAANVTINSNISGTTSIEKTGAGTLLLAGTNTFSGGVTIGDGTTDVTNVVQIGVDSVGTAGSITSGAFGTGTLTTAGGKISSDSTAARTILNDVVMNGGGDGSINLGDATNNGLLTFEGGINLTTGRTVNVLSEVEFAGVVSGGILTKAGGSNLILSGNNTFDGVTVNGSNVVTVASNNALGTTNTLANTGAVIQLNNGVTTDSGSDLVFSGTGNAKTLRLENGSSNQAEFAGSITSNETGGSNTILSANGNSGNNYSPDQILTISGQITASNLAIRGPGVVALSNASNSISGSIDLNDRGTALRILTSGALGNAVAINHDREGRVELVDGVVTNSTTTLNWEADNSDGLDKRFELLDLNNGVAETATWGGAVTINEPTFTDVHFVVNGSEDTLTIAGDISGSGFEKSGAGNLVLTGTNTYTSTTDVEAGTLQIGNDGTSGTLGTGDTSISAGATLAFNRSDDTYSYGGVISGDGAVSQIGSGTTTLTGDNTYTGGTSITSGTLLVNNTTGSGTGSGPVTVGNGTDPATLGGSGSISGATTISGNATHTAGTATNADTLTHGALTYSAGSTITWNLISGSVASGTPGSDWDLFVTTGLLDFTTGAAKTFAIIDTSSFDFDSVLPNDFTDFLVWDNAIAPTGFLNSNFTITYNGLMTGPEGGSFMLVQDSNDIVLRFTAVPEPGTYAAMAMSLAGFGWFVRRRKRKSAD